MKIIKRYWLAVIVLILFLTAVFLIIQKLSQKEIPPDLIVGVGRFDGDVINLNTKYGGKLIKVYVQEGDKVTKGQILAELDSKEFKSQLESTKYEILSRIDEIKSKEIQLKILKSNLPEDVKKAKLTLRISQSNLKEIKSKIKNLELLVDKNKKDYKRFKNLYEKKLIPEHQFEEVKLRYESSLNDLNSLYEKKNQIVKKIKQAESVVKQAESTLLQIDILENGISSLRNLVKSLKSRESYLKSVLEDLKIKSPVDGIVLEKIGSKGEFIPPGMTVLTVLDPESLYLKIYVDTLSNGKIKIGDKAVIFLDSFPDKPIKSKVVRISEKAEFTPKEVAVREDRIQRVYAVHIKPLKINNNLKLGLPAVGVISIGNGKLPESLNELPEI